MKAIAVKPLTAGSARLVDIPDPVPKEGEIIVKLLEVGLCGTDAEINDGLYGEAPPGEPFLVLGHEGLGRRLDTGELVVPLVRRPCGRCPNCEAGGQDMCSSGAFTERGIKGLHGMLRERMAEDPRYLIPVPETARGLAVLMEPMSVVAKGLRQAELIQTRLVWKPRRALVLGAGPIGLLAALTLRTLGWDVLVMARKPEGSPKAGIAAGAGARYRSVEEVPIPALAKAEGLFDLIFEATGSAEAAFESMAALAANGVLCLTSITGGQKSAQVPVDRLNLELVLGNKLVFGAVNAHRKDFFDGLAHLQRIASAFPGLLDRLFTRKVSFADHRNIFEARKDGIKTVFSVETLTG